MLSTYSTTLERPIVLFCQEQPLLTPLPPLPFIGTQEKMRKVGWDCLLSFAGSRYFAPWAYVAKQVWVRTSQGRKLIVRNQSGAEIARHLLTNRKGPTLIDPAHYEGLRQSIAKTRPLLEGSFLQRFPQQRWFLKALMIQHKTNALDHLRAILALAEGYAPEALIAAFERARNYNTYSHRFVRGLLQSGAISAPPAVASDTLPGPSPTMTNALSPYQQILEATP